MQSTGRFRQNLATVTALVLVIAGCSGDVTESEEYLDLQSELETQTSEVQTLQSDLEDSQAKEAELGSELEGLRTQIEDLTAELDDASSRAEAAESDLEDFLNRPWPDAVKELFVVGCTEGPNGGLTDEEESQLCVCMVDELEQTISLDDFIVFSSLAFASEGTGDINPLTGFPSDLDDEVAEMILSAGTTCALSLEQRRVLLA